MALRGQPLAGPVHAQQHRFRTIVQLPPMAALGKRKRGECTGQQAGGPALSAKERGRAEAMEAKRRRMEKAATEAPAREATPSGAGRGCNVRGGGLGRGGVSRGGGHGDGGPSGWLSSGRGGVRGRGGGSEWQGSRSEARSDAQGSRGRRPLADMIDYMRTCTRALDGGLASIAEEEMMASRGIEEVGDRILLLAVDQRGSKPLERLLRRAGNEAFTEAFGRLVGAFPELAPNQYASHVLEAVFASWVERIGASEAAAEPPPSVAPLAAMCASLSVDGGWPSLVDDSCASHSVRALLLALGGYAPDAKGKGKAAARAGLLPERRFNLPADVAACREDVARALVKLLREDESLCLSKNASPVVQLLLRVLKACGERALAAEAAGGVVGATGASGKPSVERCEALLYSAPGSRALEAVLETSSPEAASALFNGFFRTRLHTLVSGKAGDFGAFVAQRVADSLTEEAQLQLSLGELDFASCLGADATPTQKAVVAKFLEACLRLRACFKQGAAAVFKALGLNSSTEYQRSWPTLLALETTGSPADLLCSPRLKSRGEASGDVALEDKSPDTPNSDESAVLRSLPAAGAQILALLLRFPADAVQPLNSGMPKLLKSRPALVAMAKEARVARVLEAALAPQSALMPKLRAKLTRAFKGLLGGLGPHPVGGWVCAALWRASLGDVALREAFSKELLAVEDALRQRNFAVWKVCGLHQAKTRQEEWTQQQEKASKAQRLFGALLEGGAAAEAAAETKQGGTPARAAANAAALTDSIVADLLPDTSAAAEIKPAVGLGDWQEGPEEEEDADMDRLFARGRRGAGKKRAAKVDASAAEVPQQTAGDADLREALELIAGRAPKRVRRKQRKANSKSAAGTGDDDDDE